MESRIEVPDGSIYFWMYTQGLKHMDIDDVTDALMAAGKNIRNKDLKNYWNGWYNAELYRGSQSVLEIPAHDRCRRMLEWVEYPEHPYLYKPTIENRWVPCCQGRPLIKWSHGCMPRSEAEAWHGADGLAENLKGCGHIVVDFDGDHDPENLDMDCIILGNMMAQSHSARVKPLKVREVPGYASFNGTRLGEMAVSLHVEFLVDRVVPSMHFAEAHIDILGNQRNQIRYFKNKIWNGIQPDHMDSGTWRNLMNYIDGKERK